jgi:hypothetical protein
MRIKLVIFLGKVLDHPIDVGGLTTPILGTETVQSQKGLT